MNDRQAYRASRLAESNAAVDILEPDTLRELYDCGVDPFDILARCLSNIDRACEGEKIALDAITTAISQYQSRALLKRIEMIAEDCLIAAMEEHA